MTELRSINLDMDGTMVNFYGVEGWLDDLINERTRPYEICKPLVNFSSLARQIHRLQKIGYEVNIISWLSKSGSDEFNTRVTEAKLNYLKKHLPSVKFNKISIVKYGTPKSTCGNGYIFDDEEPNRKEWERVSGNVAHDVDNLLEILRRLD